MNLKQSLEDNVSKALGQKPGESGDDVYKISTQLKKQDDASLNSAGGVLGADTSKYTGIAQRLSGFGEYSSAATMNMFGLTHKVSANVAPLNHDSMGYVFFTRPRLNLSYDNLASVRMFSTLMNPDNRSLPRAIRATLDPVGARRQDEKSAKSLLIDDENIFIPMLSNNLLTLNGWPDPTVDTFTSKQGHYREEFAIVDGFARNFSTFELSATFRNIVDDPISKLFHFWTQYMAYVHEGVFTPYPEAIMDNEVDYDTRIYRVLLNSQRTHVTEIAAIGAGFPTINNLGQRFNFDVERPLNIENNTVNATFKCMWVDYNDPITVQEFNQAVRLFNIGMRDDIRNAPIKLANGATTTYYTQLSPPEYELFECIGYPRIDPRTMEFQWWVKTTDYQQILGMVNKK